MPSRPLPRLLALAAVLAAFAFPAAAQALEFEIVNQNSATVSDHEVWITIYTEKAPAGFDVPGFENNKPVRLDSIPNHRLTIDKLISGRVYVAYGGEGITAPLDFHSQTRFDWIELTLTPNPGDVANLTAVEQFGIGMQLKTFEPGGNPLAELASTNADTIFDALQGVPGGPESTVRDSAGNPLRVLSPLLSSSYPDLGEYVRSMAGKEIVLHSTLSGPVSGDFTTSKYSGTFEADGSITLNGSFESNNGASAPAEITMPGNELIKDIYTGANTNNDLEGAIRHDVLVGFMAGYWDSRYGNDAINFCLPQYRKTDVPQPYCETGFNQPAFAAARAETPPFPAFEQYAGVIDQYADMYGNPYSDGASGKVTVPIYKSAGKDIGTLQLTILPDAANTQPATGGGSGATPSAQSSSQSRGKAKVAVHTKLLKRARLRHGKFPVARVACSAACGRVRAVVRRGKRIVARAFFKRTGPKRLVFVRLTKPGRKLLRHGRKTKLRLDLWIAPAGQRATHRHRKLLLLH